MSGPEQSRRRLVLAAIRERADPVTIAEIADQLSIHANTVRFHLDRLLDSGQVEQVEVPARGPGRPAAHYRATQRMDPHGPRRYQMLAEILVGALARTPDRDQRALDAGRAWGRALAGEHQDQGPPTERLVNLLDDVGFSPQPRGSDQIALRHCPFLEVAQHRAEVVCPVHLGLMQGALEEWEADVAAVRLEAFVEPDLCLAHLGTTRGT